MVLGHCTYLLGCSWVTGMSKFGLMGREDDGAHLQGFVAQAWKRYIPHLLLVRIWSTTALSCTELGKCSPKLRATWLTTTLSLWKMDFGI